VVVKGENYLLFDKLLRSRLAEARLDAVALDDIVQQGGWYSLTGKELDRFVRRMLGGLLNAGMVVVVQAPRDSNVWWLLNSKYQLPIHEAIDKMIYDWRHASDGYAYFAWLTDPKNLLVAKSGSEAQPINPQDAAR